MNFNEALESMLKGHIVSIADGPKYRIVNTVANWMPDGFETEPVVQMSHGEGRLWYDMEGFELFEVMSDHWKVVK